MCTFVFMKRYIILFVCIIALGFNCLAQRNPTYCTVTHRGRMRAMNEEYKCAVKLNSLLVIGIVNPAIEIKVHKNVSVQGEVFGAFYGKNYLGTGYPYTVVAAFIEGRYYIRETFGGFYAGFNIGCASFRMNKGFVLPYKFSGPKGSYVNGQSLVLGPSVGYTFLLDKHWSIELSWSFGWAGTKYSGVTPTAYNDKGEVVDVRYTDWNSSGEWLLAYKGGALVSYRF